MQNETAPKRRIISNRVTEKEIRDWLDDRNYNGSMARFSELELHAIRRPGWEQVFRFTVSVRQLDQSERETLFGVLQSDERKTNASKQVQISTFLTDVDQQKMLETSSAGMYICQTGQNGKILWTALFFLAFLVVAIVIGNLLN